MKLLNFVRERKAKAVTALLALLLGVSLPGYAAAAPPTIPADPTGGALADVQTGVQTWVLTYGVPVLFGLILLGILIRLGMRWARKAGSKVG